MPVGGALLLFFPSSGNPVPGGNAGPIQCSGLFGWTFWFPSAPIAPGLPPDLVAAVVARLRSWNGSVFATAIGDSLTTPKIDVDEALFSPAAPWVRVTELGETAGVESIEQDGTTSYYDSGQLQISIFATSKTQARTLRDSAALALDDAPLVFADGVLLGLWRDGSGAPPVEGVGVGSPKIYHAFLTLRFHVQRGF